MIRVAFFPAVGIYLLVVLTFFFLAWWIETDVRRREQLTKDSLKGRVWRCPYCGSLTVEYCQSTVLKCPVCESYSEGDQHYVCQKE
jgi:rubrerythrin